MVPICVESNLTDRYTVNCRYFGHLKTHFRKGMDNRLYA